MRAFATFYESADASNGALVSVAVNDGLTVSPQRGDIKDRWYDVRKWPGMDLADIRQ